MAVLAEARRQNALTAVITNTPDSDLAQQGDFVIDWPLLSLAFPPWFLLPKARCKRK